MPSYERDICGWIHDETMEDLVWHELGDDWRCPVSGSDKSEFFPVGSDAPVEASPSSLKAADAGGYLSEWTRRGDDLEVHMADIH
jgi:rubredoxin